MAVQIAWMMEVPELYRQCYDKLLQSNTEGYKHPSPPPQSKLRHTS